KNLAGRQERPSLAHMARTCDRSTSCRLLVRKRAQNAYRPGSAQVFGSVSVTLQLTKLSVPSFVRGTYPTTWQNPTTSSDVTGPSRHLRNSRQFGSSMPVNYDCLDSRAVEGRTPVLLASHLPLAGSVKKKINRIAHKSISREAGG